MPGSAESPIALRQPFVTNNDRVARRRAMAQEKQSQGAESQRTSHKKDPEAARYNDRLAWVAYQLAWDNETLDGDQFRILEGLLKSRYAKMWPEDQTVADTAEAAKNTLRKFIAQIGFQIYLGKAMQVMTNEWFADMVKDLAPLSVPEDQKYLYHEKMMLALEVYVEMAREVRLKRLENDSISGHIHPRVRQRNPVTLR